MALYKFYTLKWLRERERGYTQFENIAEFKKILKISITMIKEANSV